MVDSRCFQVCGIQVGLVKVMGQVFKKCTFMEFALDFKLRILFISYEKESEVTLNIGTGFKIEK
jgi:hypothetical protein